MRSQPEWSLSRSWIRFSVLLAIFLAAAGAGYLASSAFGKGMLREELVRQLSRVLSSPVEIEGARFVVSIESGLEIEAWRLSTYVGAEGPQLSIQHGRAALNLASLALGRLRLQRLVLEGAQLRVQRLEEEGWSPLPVSQLAAAQPETIPGDFERRIKGLRAFESVARFFLERGLLASKLELRNGRIHFVDRRVRSDSSPLELVLDDINGSLAHSWISGETDLSLRTHLLDRQGTRTPIEADGRKRGDGVIHLALAWTQLDLHHLHPYLATALPEARLRGRLSGVVAVDSQARNHGLIELDWVVEELDAAIRVRRDPIPLESPRLHLHSVLQLHPGRLRLAQANLETGSLDISASGVVERPVRESSVATLAGSISGVDRSELQEFIAALPDSDREALGLLVERVRGGEIVRLGAEGTAHLALWRHLFAGELSELPDTFVLSAELADVVVGTSEVDQLEDLRAKVEWRGNRIELRDTHALWNGKPLPELSASIEGVSGLLDAKAEDRVLRVEASRLPALGTVWELFARDAPAEGESVSLPAVRVEIAEIQHATLRWPVRDAKLNVTPRDDGFALAIERATWAGVPVVGKGVWVGEPNPRLSLDLRVGSVGRTSGGSVDTFSGSGNASESGSEEETKGVWLSGRFSVDPVKEIAVPFSRLEGDFAIRDSTLEISSMTGDLLPSGEFEAGGELDLGSAEILPLSLHFEIVDGDVATLTKALGFPPDFASGRARVMGELEGRARRQEPLLSGLTGSVDVAVGEGAVYRSLPVVTTVASVTEGLVTEDVVRFEQIETILNLDHGVISTDRFALDGPMRLLADGSFDPSQSEDALDITFGIFVMRQLDQMLGHVPLIKHLTDSDKGLFGVYYELTGTWQEPRVRSLPLKSLAEGNLLSQIIQAPLRMLRELESVFAVEDETGEAPPRETSESPSPLKRKGMRRPDRRAEEPLPEAAPQASEDAPEEP